MDEAELRRRTMRKVSRRLIPFMIAMFCVNFLDRVNIGFAALQMNRDLGLTPEVYGFAAGILFISYTALEIPSNLMLDRVGARLWLSRIMVTWGLIASANAFVYDRPSLYVMRFLLGAAEAGFFPGLMLYVTHWFPARERAGAVTLFMIGSPLSVIFGAPLSTAILSLDHVGGFAGWQWLFVVEGLPAVLLGVIGYTWLTDRPEKAHWLADDERMWLAATLAEEARLKASRKGPSHTLGVFLHGPTLLLALSKFCVLLAFFGVTLWLPLIVRSLGRMSDLEVGFVSALPYVCSAIGSIVIGRSSDRSGERGLHIALPAFVGALGFVAAALTSNPYLALAALCVATTGLWVSNTVFWTLPTAILVGTPAAAGIALINCFGNLGGFFGPTLTGWVRGGTGSFGPALAVLGGSLAVSGVIVLFIARTIPAHPHERTA